MRNTRLCGAAALALALVASTGCGRGDERAAIDALARGDLARARELYRAGADVNARVGGLPTDSATPLMFVASTENVDAARMLLELGADPDLRATGGVTALMIAAAAGRTAMTEVLLDAGADASIRDAEGATALDRAERAGHADLAARLRAAGVE